MDIERLKSELNRDEDEVLHAYVDSMGYLTIGVGRLIDKRRGGGISHDESMYLLGNDIERVCAELAERVEGWSDLNDARQRALANMAFQMGVDGLMQFHNTLAAVKASDWGNAYAGAKNSLWARQTPARAERVASMLRDGVA